MKCKRVWNNSAEWICSIAYRSFTLDRDLFETKSFVNMKPEGDIMLQLAANKEGDDFLLKHNSYSSISDLFL